ncbi:MAG: leucyl/phenylalanyl-tRNA--protein transferase [Desulfobacula sp.]|nr:leucyl/phenylalanyl-tRNA--protein transferase [Desulfobacula sp.]
MPLFRLSEKLDFPPAYFARSDGLLCVGGDLTPQRLILAYERGIFPWFSESEPLLWWSPDPRLVLFPGNIHISKSLKKKIKRSLFDIKIDNAFEETIRSCALVRKDRDEGTWIIPEMVSAYTKLHGLGYAHSIEAWQDNKLVGGLYGVCIGGSFFGESMFSFVNDASKIALVVLANLLKKNKFDLIDCQVTTQHLLDMGACEIPRAVFLNIIKKSVKRKMDKNLWNLT